MLGLATARLSRRYTPAIVKCATYRGIKISRRIRKKKGWAQIYFATLPLDFTFTLLDLKIKRRKVVISFQI